MRKITLIAALSALVAAFFALTFAAWLSGAGMLLVDVPVRYSFGDLAIFVLSVCLTVGLLIAAVDLIVLAYAGARAPSGVLFGAFGSLAVLLPMSVVLATREMTAVVVHPLPAETVEALHRDWNYLRNALLMLTFAGAGAVAAFLPRWFGRVRGSARGARQLT